MVEKDPLERPRVGRGRDIVQEFGDRGGRVVPGAVIHDNHLDTGEAWALGQNQQAPQTLSDKGFFVVDWNQDRQRGLIHEIGFRPPPPTGCAHGRFSPLRRQAPAGLLAFIAPAAMVPRRRALAAHG